MQNVRTLCPVCGRSPLKEKLVTRMPCLVILQLLHRFSPTLGIGNSAAIMRQKVGAGSGGPEVSPFASITRLRYSTQEYFPQI